MCGRAVCSILLLSIVTRCLEKIDVCIWRMFVFYVCCSDCVGVCGNVCCVAAVVKYNGFQTTQSTSGEAVRRLQTDMQIVLKPPATINGGQIYCPQSSLTLLN